MSTKTIIIVTLAAILLPLSCERLVQSLQMRYKMEPSWKRQTWRLDSPRSLVDCAKPSTTYPADSRTRCLTSPITTKGRN